MKRFNSIRTKMMALFIATSLLALIMNILMYVNINQVLQQMDLVYEENLKLNDMTEELQKIQNSMFQYLEGKSSASLETYYSSGQAFQNGIAGFKVTITENPIDLLESNIGKMSGNYIKITEEAVQAKRGRNVSKYNEKYKEATKLYGYLNSYITKLNQLQFQENSNNYKLLQDSLGYLELVSMTMILLVIICNILMIVRVTKRITEPLESLAQISNQVTKGNMEVEIPNYETRDEVEVLAHSFDKMMASIRDYIEKQRESIEKENELREKDLKSRALLKDAQLKYLQSQVNPHFLFNTLNAGMQLATIEDAERTAVYIENMAEFFRYNLSKVSEDTELADEIRMVDHYMYILHVRFGDDIHFEKDIDESLLNVRVPSMILQPLIENAVQYGIRDVSWDGKIKLIVKQNKDTVQLIVEDNGKGMSQELIDRVLRGEKIRDEKSKKSNGIGVHNVLERLRMYFDREDVMEIESEGENKGTRFILKVPYQIPKEETDV